MQPRARRRTADRRPPSPAAVCAPDNAAETKANFNADANIAYDVVVATLDAMRQTEEGKTLFPDVAFAAGIL